MHRPPVYYLAVEIRIASRQGAQEIDRLRANGGLPERATDISLLACIVRLHFGQVRSAPAPNEPGVTPRSGGSRREEGIPEETGDLRSSFRIANIGGIDIGVHYTWFLIFFLLAWTLAAGFFPQQFPGLGTTIYWLMGFTASLLLFVSVLVHELAHSFTAEAKGLRVRGITLFVFGGVSNIEGEPRSAPDELLIAAVGPLSSLVLGVLFYVVWLGLGLGFGPVGGVVLYLAGINVLLAVFNLIPGFPLDGGRVLRAAVWWATNSVQTATRVAVASGHIVAFLFIFGGLFLAFTGAFLSGIWLILIGWFLNNAATASGQQAQEGERLQGVKVQDVMNPHPVTVDPHTDLLNVVQDHILQRGVRALPVVDDGRLVGLVTLNEIRSVPREEWASTPIEAVMTGAQELRTVSPRDDLSNALGALAEYDVNQLPVEEDGRLAGLLSRSNVIRFLQIRDELGASDQEEERRAA